MSNKKILYFGLVTIILILVIGIFIQNKKKSSDVFYTVPLPEEVVRQYFTAWSNKDYPNMYATLSDGFKKLEPTAKDLATFREFASSQGIEEIKIINIKEESNDGTTAQVDYSVEFILNNLEKRSFSGTFTLKYRQGDIIPGWKLTHPYGENVDVS